MGCRKTARFAKSGTTSVPKMTVLSPDRVKEKLPTYLPGLNVTVQARTVVPKKSRSVASPVTVIAVPPGWFTVPGTCRSNEKWSVAPLKEPGGQKIPEFNSHPLLLTAAFARGLLSISKLDGI